MNIITKYSNIAVVKYGSTKVLREQVTKLSLEELGKRGKGGAALVTPRLQLR